MVSKLVKGNIIYKLDFLIFKLHYCRLKKKDQNKSDEIVLVDDRISPTENNLDSNRIQTIKKNAKTRKTKIHVNNMKLREENMLLRRKIDNDRKKIERLNIKANPTTPLSPISNLKKTLENSNLDKELQSTLIVGEVLKQQITATYKELNNNKEKDILKTVTSGKIVKKSGMLTQMNKIVAPVPRNRERIINLAKEEFIKIIKDFYFEYSTIDPSKNGFVTINKEKHKRQFLQGTMKDLYHIFCLEKNIEICYTTFTKYRPDQCVEPKMSQRNTCACVVHENITVLAKALHSYKLIKENSDIQVSNAYTCLVSTENCFQRTCSNCKNKKISLDLSNFHSPIIDYNKWVSKSEERISAKTNKEIIVKLTKKEKRSLNTEDMQKYLDSEVEKFMEHCYRYFHQKNTLDKLRKSIPMDTCVIIIDFSENYVCKYGTEVQGAHFGASKTLVTLHTGVIYTHNNSYSFATLSS